MQQDTYDFGESPGKPVFRQVMDAWRGIRERLDAIDRRLALWQFRAESRKELARLERHVLRDVGLDPIEVSREAYKPFWKP